MSSDEGETPAIEMVGQHMKELVNSLNRLEQLGVERYNLPLPKIVVVGDQSAGKSSLIEAISEIKVPRNSGTCTRCPLQINLTENDEPNATWCCQVTLDKKYHYLGDRSGIEDPWMLNEDSKTEFPFKTTRDVEELARVLHWAQIAILNPGKNQAHYASADELGLPDSIEVKFSPNIVRLDISGPGLPYLSFYDLPGVISQAESDRDKHLVRLVRNLVENYIESPNTLVLLTCSMEGDVANSTASMIVREMNATERCIGVLTKPDRLPADDPIDTWREILEGKIFQVGHSYYVTKQPQQSLLNKISWSEARKQEVQFFEKTEPWNTELADFKHRFGTAKLQKVLSHKLTREIYRSIPNIKHKIDIKIEYLNDQLSKMPSPPLDTVILTVSDYIGRFCGKVEKDVEGEPPYNDFKNRWKEKIVSFQEVIRSLKPILIDENAEPITSAFTNTNGTSTPKSTPRKARQSKRDVDNAEVVSLLSDGDSGPSPKKRKHEERSTPTPMQTPRKASGLPQRAKANGNSVNSNVFTVEKIRHLATAVSTCDIPGRLDPRAIDHIINKAFSVWNDPVMKFVAEFRELLREHLMATLQEQLSSWRSTEFFRQSMEIVNIFVMKLVDELLRFAEYVLRVEQFKPITSNTSMGEKKAAELHELETQRFVSRAHAYFDRQDEQAGNSANPNDRKRQIERDNGKALKGVLGADSYANEVRMLAETRAYYDIASVRLVDNLWMNIRADLLERCRIGLLEDLRAGLHLYADDAREYCTQLLAEDPAREVRRRQLKLERETLLKAQREVRDLEEKFAT